MRYYYKKLDESAWFNLRVPLYANVEGYTEITEEEWNQHLIDIEPESEEVK